MAIAWDKTMETGDAVLDAQHKKLIATLADLLQGMKDGTAKDKLVPALDYLVTYTKRHFTHEEGCMERFKCPVAQRNKSAHQEFIQMLTAFQARVQREGVTSLLVIQLEKELGVWVVQHLQRVDSQLKPCVKRVA